jgi:uncharacterized membrane protein (DUF106 family)
MNTSAEDQLRAANKASMAMDRPQIEMTEASRQVLVGMIRGEIKQAVSEGRQKFRFDPTINAGHVLTFVVMAAGVVGSYAMLDKRVVVLEEKDRATMVQSTELRQEQKEALREIRSDVKDLQRSVNEIGRTLSVVRRP